MLGTESGSSCSKSLHHLSLENLFKRDAENFYINKRLLYPMKLPSPESNHWSIEVSFIYSLVGALQDLKRSFSTSPFIWEDEMLVHLARLAAALQSVYHILWHLRTFATGVCNSAQRSCTTAEQWTQPDNIWSCNKALAYLGPHTTVYGGSLGAYETMAFLLCILLMCRWR